MAKSGPKWGKQVFRGLNAITIDAKGRMAMPSRFRSRLKDDEAGRLVVTIDTEDACLLLYPMSTWEVIERKIEALPSFNPVTRRVKRLLIGHATEVDMDGQGRLLLPPLLREHAGIDKKAMLVGQGNKFEVWSETCWQGSCESWLSDQATQDALPDELRGISV